MNIRNFLIILSVLALSLCFISAGNVFIGNISSNLESSYGRGDSLRGWINFSFVDMPFNSLISLGSSNITYKSLLDLNQFSSPAVYSCSVSNCNMTYTTSDSGTLTKSFSLGVNQTKLIGIEITGGVISNIRNFSLNLGSNATESCSNQLSVDVLDDGVDWINSAVKQNSFCSTERYGCYSPPGDLIPIEQGKQYCENITLGPGAELLVGANISGAGTTNLRFTVSGDEIDDYCIANSTNNGVMSCIIDTSLDKSTPLNVCLESDTNSGYSIYYEDNAPVCGSVDGDDHDLSIFGKTLKFDSIGTVSLNSSGLDSEIDSYMSDNYDYNCTDGCFIPIRLISNVNQNIVVNSASIDYTLKSIPKTNKTLYGLDFAPSLMTMPFRVLNITGAGLIVPNSSGVYNVSLLFLNTDKGIVKQINVLSLPIINDVSPVNVPAAMDSTFNAIVSGNASSFSWNFGDNSTAETTVSYVTHKYSAIGLANLVLTARNSNGATSRNFSINVVSPKDYINSTIERDKTKVTNLRDQINSLPSLLKTFFENKYGLTSIDSTLTSLMLDYQNAGGDDQKYIGIMNSLSNISLPDLINYTGGSSGNFLFDKAALKLDDLKQLDGAESNITEAKIQESNFNWFLKSLDVNYDSKIYSSITYNQITPLVTYIKLTVTPKADLEKVYILIGASNVQTSSGTAKSLGGSTGITLSNLVSGSAQTVELIVPGGTDLEALPIYFSTTLSELSKELVLGVCNNNGKCEAGENYQNCRSDCKPWGKAILWILVALFFVLCLYIALQEWYKKRYEGYLFKDKNDLYNLISFISNSEKQGMSRSDIFDKLRDKDWHGEQINYAYRKYKGFRTGMFEIPIFKFLENREVKQQLAFRDQRSPDNSTVPKPNMPFIKPNSFNSFRPNNSVQLGKINRPITPRDVQKSVFANPARIMSTPKQSPQFIKPQQQVPAKINPAAAQPSSPSSSSSSALASPNNLPPKNPGYKQFGEQMYQKKVEEKKIEPENKDKITDNKK